MTYQKTTIIGFLGRDPSLKTLDSGTVICEFAVAVTERVKIQGEYGDKTTWYDVITFGKQAETHKTYLKKGSQIYCEGKVDPEAWIGKDGTAKSKLKLVADVVKFIGGKSQQKEEPSIRVDQLASSQTITGSGFSANNQFSDDDDIPF